jgi:hypothetical protein
VTRTHGLHGPCACHTKIAQAERGAARRPNASRAFSYRYSPVLKKAPSCTADKRDVLIVKADRQEPLVVVRLSLAAARRQILETTFDELIRPDSHKRFADMPLAAMNANAVEVLRDRKLATPEAANGRIKAMRQVFKWGVVKGYAPLRLFHGCERKCQRRIGLSAA